MQKRTVSQKKDPETARETPPGEGAAREGAGPVRSITPEQLETMRRRLVGKRDSLARHVEAELDGLGSDDRHHLADLEEMASDTQDTDAFCGVMEVSARTLEQIDEALARIDDGTYGLCQECREEIPFERLEAIPFATLCVSCKRRQELSGPT